MYARQPRSKRAVDASQRSQKAIEAICRSMDRSLDLVGRRGAPHPVRSSQTIGYHSSVLGSPAGRRLLNSGEQQVGETGGGTLSVTVR
jgi:hypothetical protein